MLLGVKLLELFLSLYPLRSSIHLVMAQMRAACVAAKVDTISSQGSVTTTTSDQLYVSLELHHAGSPGLDSTGNMCERPRVISVLSSLLDRVVARNETQILAHNHSICPQKMTVFHGFKAPNISIEKYLERIFKYANCSPSCFVVAYAYIDRFIRQQPGIPITSLNVHRLLITSVMVAAKFLDDA
jgi:hypothetical protein